METSGVYLTDLAKYLYMDGAKVRQIGKVAGVCWRRLPSPSGRARFESLTRDELKNLLREAYRRKGAYARKRGKDLLGNEIDQGSAQHQG